MAEHSIKITVPSMTLSKMDTVFEIKQDGRKLGEVHISKGGIDWYGPKA